MTFFWKLTLSNASIHCPSLRRTSLATLFTHSIVCVQLRQTPRWLRLAMTCLLTALATSIRLTSNWRPFILLLFSINRKRWNTLKGLQCCLPGADIPLAKILSMSVLACPTLCSCDFSSIISLFLSSAYDFNLDSIPLFCFAAGWYQRAHHWGSEASLQTGVRPQYAYIHSELVSCLRTLCTPFSIYSISHCKCNKTSPVVGIWALRSPRISWTNT